MLPSTRQFVPLLALYALIVSFTQHVYFGDTMGYVQNIVLFDRNPAAGALDFWDFGHLLWRPSAWLLYRTFGGLFPYAKTGEDHLTITALLVAMNVVASFVSMLLFRSLARRFLTSHWAADFVSITFLCFHSVLNYLHAGVSYVSGMMWLTLALWLMLRAVENEPCAPTFALLSGAAGAMALLLWFPYAIAVPGVAATALLWFPQASFLSLARERIRLIAIVLGCTAVLTIAAYGLPITQLHLYSMAAVKQWIANSSHGWAQNRRMLRLVTGLPRSFVWTGDEGLLLKRYFFHDPYARVTLLQIAAEFWPILTFYIFLAALLWILFLRVQGRQVLLLLAIAAVPLVLFAVFVFEPGSLERYMPVYPFLCIAVAYALSRYREQRAAAILIAVLLSVTIALNVRAMWKGSLESEQRSNLARARSLQTQIEPSGVVALLSIRDGLYSLPSADPFNKEVRHIVLPVYDVLEPGTRRALDWKQEFAQRALTSFRQGARVWVSKRLLAGEPLPEWGWTEGDDPHLHWRDVPVFFSRFRYSGDVGGPDGFLELEPSTKNQELLKRPS